MKQYRVHLDPQIPAKHKLLLHQDGTAAPEANQQLTFLRLRYCEAEAEEDAELMQQIDAQCEDIASRYQWKEDWLVMTQSFIMGSMAAVKGYGSAMSFAVKKPKTESLPQQTLLMNPATWKHWLSDPSQYPVHAASQVFYTCTACLGMSAFNHKPCASCSSTGSVSATPSGDYPLS